MKDTIVHIAYCKLPTELIWKGVLNQLNNKELPGIIKYYRWQDQCRSWLGRCLVASLLDSVSHEYNPSNLKTTAFGRPYIDHCADFNISHSGDIVISAITIDGSIGIDIEQEIDININDFLFILSADQYLQVIKDQEPQKMFYRIWTMKESVVKLIGNGIGMPLQHIYADFITAHFENKKYFLTELKIENNYSCFMATDHPVSHYDMKELDIDSFKIK